MSQKEILEQINELFRQAEEEEQNYNWDKEIEILKKAEKICFDNKVRKMQGEVYYKLGEIHQIAADYQKNKEKVLKHFQLSISNFEKALNSFKELKIDEKINATLGSINLLKYISGVEEEKGVSLLESAMDYTKKAKLIFNQKGNVIDSLKIAILGNRAFSLLIGEKSIRIDELADFNELTSEFRDSALEIADGIINLSEFPEIYAYYFFISLTEFSIWSVFSLPIEESIRSRYLLDFINLSKKFIDSTIDPNSSLLIFSVYTVYSFFNTIFGIFTKINQFEQKKYMKIAENWLKKGDPY
ncbi:MAG: hypothetical protein HWN67_23055 [Candidatus Helarchaeota archaeon]|nr:hypothetical protein [Candidatus Helarchaeota archaeon]